MRVFLTGATGFVGSAIVRELLDAGHQVLGLARSKAGAETLSVMGAEVQRGELDDLASLRAGAMNADAVIHTAFNHDFSKFVANCESDRKGLTRWVRFYSVPSGLCLVTSGTGLAAVAPGQQATEEAPSVSTSVHPRAASEEASVVLQEKGGHVIVIRLAQVHDTRKQGLVTYLIQTAKEKGISAYVGDGSNRWPAAHVTDTARLYRLALEKAASGARYNAVAESGVSLRQIAQVVGDGLRIPVVSLLPEQAQEHLGWLAPFAGWDIPASSERTRRELNWEPIGPDLLTDLRNMDYSAL